MSQFKKFDIWMRVVVEGLDAATVLRVIDADTVEVDLRGNKVDVRLLLVDTPEIHEEMEAFGTEATAFSNRVLSGRKVQLEYDSPKWDHYGRLLAYIWIDGKMFNQLLLEEGLAHVTYVYDPPYKYYDALMRAQTRARDARKGIWSKGGLVQMELFE